MAYLILLKDYFMLLMVCASIDFGKVRLESGICVLCLNLVEIKGLKANRPRSLRYSNLEYAVNRARGVLNMDRQGRAKVVVGQTIISQRLVNQMLSLHVYVWQEDETNCQMEDLLQSVIDWQK